MNFLMKFRVAALLLVCLAGQSSFAEPKPVAHVDVGRYLGHWYQISHVPLWFEGGSSCTCARQTLTASGTPGVVNVFNSCNDQTPQGPLKTISGTATSDDPVSNAKFTVDFHLAQKGSYWIVGLDPQYRYAVVTDRGAYSLYILSKTPKLDTKLYNEAVAIAKSQSLSIDSLEMTTQDGCKYPK